MRDTRFKAYFAKKTMRDKHLKGISHSANI